MNDVAKCPECGRVPSIHQNMDYSIGKCECCGVSIFGVDRWNKYAAAMELAKAHKAFGGYMRNDKDIHTLVAELEYAEWHVKEVFKEVFNEQ